MNDWIPVIIPDVGFSEIEQDIKRILATGILTTGPYVVNFEKSIAEWVGVDHAVATTSATTALHLALTALEVGPGDEVLIPDFQGNWDALATVLAAAPDILNHNI